MNLRETWGSVVLATMLGTGCWLGCSPGGDNTDSGETVGPSRHAVDPAWTPNDLAPVAWYFAAPGDDNVLLQNGVYWWNDRSSTDLDATADYYWARPQFHPDAWGPT